MKKALTWILALCVVVALVGSMTACSTIRSLLGNKQSGLDSSTVKDEAPAGDESGTDEGTDEGSQGGPATVQTERLKTRADIMTKLGSQYYIKTKNINGTGVAEVATNGNYTYYTRPSATFTYTGGGNVYVYSDLRDDDKYYAMARTDGAAADILAGGTIANIFLYEDETISYHTKSDVTFADRAAVKYVYTDAAGISQELVVDKYSGACLQHDGKGAATDGFTGGLATASFEVVKLEMGNSATTTLNGIVARVAITGWDTEWFAATGLNVATLQVPGGTLERAEWAHNSTRTADNAEWVAVYNVISATPEAQRLNLRNFMRSFFDAGAKYNDSRDQTAFDIVYNEVWNGGDLAEISFSGRIFGEAGDYSVYIVAEYVDAVPSCYWKVTIGVKTY